MNESTKKLISLLKNNATINDIKHEMNLTNAQLAYRLSLLKNSGYLIQPNYYKNGETTLSLKTEFDPYHYLYNNYAKIYTTKEDQEIRFLVISDLHYFDKNENRTAVDNAFNYCIKNGIHFILICGDIINGMKSDKIPIEKQVEQFIKLYPQDDSIINLCVLGNHDIKPLEENCMDPKKQIERKRLDIAVLGYMEAKILIKKDIIFLRHAINNHLSFHHTPDNLNYLIFQGHSHKAKFNDNIINVPSLSNLQPIKNFTNLAQAFDVTIKFNKKEMINQVMIQQVLMEQTPCIICENIITLNHQENLYNNHNTETNEYPTSKILTRK